MMAQQQHRKRDENDQQDGESRADGADEVAERLHVLNQLRMLGRIALYALAQERDLVFDAPHLNGLILHSEIEIAVAGLDFSQTLMQLFLRGGLCRTVPAGEVE